MDSSSNEEVPILPAEEIVTTDSDNGSESNVVSLADDWNDDSETIDDSDVDGEILSFLSGVMAAGENDNLLDLQMESSSDGSFAGDNSPNIADVDDSDSDVLFSSDSHSGDEGDNPADNLTAESPRDPIVVQSSNSNVTGGDDSAENRTAEGLQVLSHNVVHSSLNNSNAAAVESMADTMRSEDVNGSLSVSVHRPELRNFAAANLDSSLDLFKVEKRKVTMLPKTAVPFNNSVVSDGGEDGESCPICFEPWTNSGLHRLAALRCGHLFGQSCIEKWLKGQTGKCPQCNAKSHRRDIRVLFARSLKTVDTTERDRAIEELEKEKEARRNAELEAAKARMHHQMALNECRQLRQELERQRQQVELLRKSSSGNPVDGLDSGLEKSCDQGTYVFEKIIKINEFGGCRVLAYCSQMATLCVSQQSANNLFPGFGVKKISVLDFKTSEFVWTHTKAIRDIAFNQRTSDATMLSCSVDKSIRLTSLHSNKIIHTYDCELPVWSCAWDSNDRNCFFAGLQNGKVFMFDVRNLSETVQQFNTDASSRSPVVSLQSLPATNGNSPRPGGILVGQLDRSSFYEKRNSGDYKLHLLPLEASLTSLSLEESTSHVLASYRPSTRCPNSRHQVCELAIESSFDAESNSVNTDCTCHSVQMFYSGATQKLLTRSRLIRAPGGELLACAGDEASLSVCIWNAGNGQLQQKMPTSDPVIDLCPIVVNELTYLAGLSEKSVCVYKYK